MMNTSFRISLLYLLLMIPHYKNSPLPVMEAWLQKDQNDGFVQRDMTSSLTGGDESFGSAHKTYQNSLIRRKKADNFGNTLPDANSRLYNYLTQNERGQNPSIFFENGNNDYYSETENNGGDGVAFQDFDANLDRRSSRLSHLNMENEKNFNSFPLYKFTKDRFVYAAPSKDEVPSNNQMNNIDTSHEWNFFPTRDDSGKNTAGWSLCKRFKERYIPPIGYLKAPVISPDTVSLRDSNLYNERVGREVSYNEYKDPVNFKPADKSFQIFDENEYYDAEANPLNDEVDLLKQEKDYNRMLPDHSNMHKRDKSKQQLNFQQQKIDEKSPDIAGIVMPQNNNAPKYTDQIIGLANRNSIKQDILSKGIDKFGNIKNMYLKNRPNSEFINLNSNSRLKDSPDSLKHSEGALKKSQLGEELLLKSQQQTGRGGFKRESFSHSPAKCEKNNFIFDEKRLKREDEDEQKNMKTGTDEGGGGEYEEEEGKGHKDEEEYYEDADLSDNEIKNEVRINDDSQKYIKREAVEGANLKDSKDESNDNNSEDYDLTLENAPIENSEKMKKTLHSDGGKAKKNCVRKGVKIWDQWGKWSPCSVTCGVGRSTRWRHCIGGGCAQGEKEAQIKRCTNPAC